MSRLIPSIDLSDVPSGSSPSTYESRWTWEKATLPAGSQMFDDWFGNVEDDDEEINLDEISKEWSELEDQFYNQERQAGESEVEEIPDPTIYVTKAKNMAHYEIPDNFWIEQADYAKGNAEYNEPDLWKRNALKTFYGIRRKFSTQTACKAFRDSCKPVFGRFATVNEASVTFEQTTLVQEFLKNRGLTCLAQLDTTLANSDRIAAEITRQRLLRYPAGTQFAGCLHEWELQKQGPPDEQYIQACFREGDSIMVICFFKKQGALFHEINYFEVDMSFKRIYQKDLNEILFGVWDEGTFRSREFLSLVKQRQYISRPLNGFLELWIPLLASLYGSDISTKRVSQL
ncbi:uncharacterized protein SEPMUDRAFT_121771 [Sphaerulina musiva SO2202]|uniref:Uncharacterized protein n=1 Tax=Sphaerulina musiva (strain SO2202) TaxID=692275 RepID=M3BNX8_SPHMS|nr:uncharacterized protein SEPMUDRAFT_121771 [Sphaerulina musiva SO2202]EMF07883.1 hypothetical protein SEPMUDRAFT_121771 [Sphaerulina musiva SO2202]